VIPYFEQPKLHLGPLTIHAFGALVATGILLAFRLIRKRAPQVGLDPVLAEQLAMRMVIVSFISAHIVDRIAYYPRDVLANPLSLLYIWESISSFGGFLGSIIVASLFMRKHGGSLGWRYLDLIAYVFPLAWMFGRMGCTVAYDHPGIATHFFLGQRYSDHIVRHNLGLYEALYTVVLVLLFHYLGKDKRHAPGFFVGVLPLAYAPVRFLLDFLRIEDARYFGFTPGQYGSVLLVGAGLWVLRQAKRRQAAEQAQPSAARR
jgi:phosphatidylglycerol---prolipoprotein diacylglyceryl transferase